MLISSVFHIVHARKQVTRWANKEENSRERVNERVKTPTALRIRVSSSEWASTRSEQEILRRLVYGLNICQIRNTFTSLLLLSLLLHKLQLPTALTDIAIPDKAITDKTVTLILPSPNRNRSLASHKNNFSLEIRHCDIWKYFSMNQSMNSSINLSSISSRV